MPVNISAMIAQHGDRGAVLSIDRLTDLAQDVAQLTASADYQTGGISWMATDTTRFLPEGMAITPRSIIVVVSPSPGAWLHFTCEGKTVNLRLPPTYTDGNREILVRQYLEEALRPMGYTVIPTGKLPQKLLTVRSGLGQYGRNFICYSPEFGSHQLISTFYSDLPCEQDTWYPLAFMPSCETCFACGAACPTGALDRKRMMINANRCLTYLNEKDGPFPDWVDDSWHNCVVGCLKCQDVCPHNRKNRGNVIDSVSFTEPETMELLAHQAGKAFSPALEEKLNIAGLKQYQDYLARNLTPLLCRG